MLHRSLCTSTYLVNLGRGNTKMILFMLLSPKVAKASSNRTLWRCVIWNFLAVKFENVKMAHLYWITCGKMPPISINRLPVSTTRWHHGSQICLKNSYSVKNQRIVNISAATEAREQTSTDLESSES